MSTFNEQYKTLLNSFNFLKEELDNSLQEYDLIPISDVKRAEDVKEMWFVYELDSLRQKNQLKELLETHLEEVTQSQINETWNLKLHIKDLEENKLAVIATNLNLKEPALLKLDFTEILISYSSRIRSAIQETSKIISREYHGGDREKWDTLSWVRLFHPKIIGIKTKYKELERKHPELKGIFESERQNVPNSILLRFTNLHSQDKKVLLKAIESQISAISFKRTSSTWSLHVDDANKIDLIVHLTNPEFYESNPNGIRILKQSLQAMLSTQYSKLEPDAIQFQVDRSFTRIFDNCEARLIQKEFYGLIQKLPELEGIFENKEQETVLVVGYRNENSKEDRLKILNIMAKYYKEFDLETCLEETNKNGEGFIELVIDWTSNFHKANLPNQSAIERWKKERETMVYNLYYTYLKVLRDNGKIKMPLISSMPAFRWTTRHYFMVNKLPELEGIFESTEKYIELELYFNPTKGTQDHEKLKQGLKALKDCVLRWLPECKKSRIFEFKSSYKFVCYFDKKQVSNEEIKKRMYGFIQQYWDRIKRTEGLLNIPISWMTKWTSPYTKMVKKLPELEGIFENVDEEVKFRMWFKTDPNIKNDFNSIKLKIAIGSFKAGATSLIKGCKNVVVKRRDNGFVVDVIFDKTFEADEANKNRICRIIENHWSEIQRKHELDKTVSNYTGKWISVYAKLIKKLPELEGIFESVQNEFGDFESEQQNKFVDIKVTVNKTDRYGAPTTLPLVDSIAYELIRNTGNIMRNLYQTGKYSYKYKIFKSPLGFVILDVPANIAKDYLYELNRTITFLDRWADGAYGYYIGDESIAKTEIDERGNKTRKMVNKLPELKGIFESEQNNENDAYLFRFTNLSQEDKDFLIKSFEYANWKYTRKNEYNIHDKGPGNLDVIWPNEYTKRDTAIILNYLRNQLIMMTIENKELFGRQVKKPIREKNLNNADGIIKRGFKNCVIKPIQQKYYNLSNKLPELEGIFESKESKEELIDIGVELKKYDKYSNPTSPEIATTIANKLTKNTMYAMKENWDCKSYNLKYETELVNNPFGFVIKGVPKAIYGTYMVELKEQAFLLDREINEFVKGEDEQRYYLFDHQTIVRFYKDEYGEMKRRLPELKGIF